VDGRSWILDGSARGSKAATRLRESYDGGSESDGRKKKGEWGQPRPGPLYL
jgi:hypothetical protein